MLNKFNGDVWGIQRPNTLNGDLTNFLLNSKASALTSSFNPKDNASENLDTGFFTFNNLLVNFDNIARNESNWCCLDYCWIHTSYYIEKHIIIQEGVLSFFRKDFLVCNNKQCKSDNEQSCCYMGK